MDKKHVEEIVKAILDRKYSWACVLMLRFQGYDPSNYLPYRTYIRLLKENYQNESIARKNQEALELSDLQSSQIRLQPEVNRSRHKSESISISQYQK